MTDPYDRDPIARDLRASLERHAREAPRGDLLAERIINAAGPAPRRSVRSWRTWSLPLIAAGAVAAVVGGVVGVQSLQTSANGPANHVTGTGAVSLPASPQPSQTASVSSLPSPTSRSSGAETLRGLKVLDLTFVTDNQGWALAEADCVHGTGTCSALLHMKGSKWWSMPNATPFNVPGVTGGCVDPCVTNIRFADPDTGYAFGPSALFMTTDGGHHWTRQEGGAIALETLDDNVIRITSTGTGCPGPCVVRAETAAIGSTTWAQSDLEVTNQFVAGIEFSRGQPGNAYLLVTRNPAGGAQDETSTLYRSTDDGAHWTSAGEPCPQQGGEVDSHAVSGGGAQRVSVLCASRMAPQRWFVATSTDGGASFAPQPGTVPAATAPQLTGDATTVLVTAGDGLARSADGGRTWHSVPEVADQIGFVGFESDKVGRALSADGKTIWTTRDGGMSWQRASFT